MTIRSTPDLAKNSVTRDYRLYDRTHCDFDDFPSYREGGPATVVHAGWGVSYSMPHGDEKRVELNAYKYEGEEEGFAKHELDGTFYDTMEDATRAAFEAGLLAFMVYERDAAKWVGHTCTPTDVCGNQPCPVDEALGVQA